VRQRGQPWDVQRRDYPEDPMCWRGHLVRGNLQRDEPQDLRVPDRNDDLRQRIVQCGWCAGPIYLQRRWGLRGTEPHHLPLWLRRHYVLHLPTERRLEPAEQRWFRRRSDVLDGRHLRELQLE